MHSNHSEEGAPSVSCAVLHKDVEGNVIPCPGYHEGEAQPDPLAEARRLLADEEQTRMQACAAELQAVLEKYGMRLNVPPPQITLAPR